MNCSTIDAVATNTDGSGNTSYILANDIDVATNLDFTFTGSYAAEVSRSVDYINLDSSVTPTSVHFGRTFYNHGGSLGCGNGNPNLNGAQQSFSCFPGNPEATVIHTTSISSSSGSMLVTEQGTDDASHETDLAQVGLPFPASAQQLDIANRTVTWTEAGNGVADTVVVLLSQTRNAVSQRRAVIARHGSTTSLTLPALPSDFATWDIQDGDSITYNGYSGHILMRSAQGFAMSVLAASSQIFATTNSFFNNGTDPYLFGASGSIAYSSASF